MVKSQESPESVTSGETTEPQPLDCSQFADTVNSSSGTESLLDKFQEHRPECETLQRRESDKEESVITNKQEAVSGPVDILPYVKQDNAISDRLQSTESATEKPVDLQEIDLGSVEVLPEVEQANVTTVETGEHNIDIKHGSQDESDLECPAIKHLRELEDVENETKTASSPESQTSHEAQSSLNSPCHGHSLGANGHGMLFEEVEESKVDPKAKDDHPERLADAILVTLGEKMCFKGETQLQAIEETETVEPPAKKRLRRRMGMCGLGDRNTRFLFEGQHCRQGLVGRQKEEGAGAVRKENREGLKDNTMVGNDGTTPMEHEETTGPACKENGESLKDNTLEENDCTALMDDEGTTGVVERENRYALRNNTNKCTALMDVEGTTENDGTVPMDDKGTTEQVILEQELTILEDITTGAGQPPLSPTIDHDLNEVQDEPSVAAIRNDHVMETTASGDEPNLPGNEMNNDGQNIELNVKEELHADKKVNEETDKIAKKVTKTPVELAQEVSCSSIGAAKEVSEGSVKVAREVQEVPTGLEESEMEIEEQCPPCYVMHKVPCSPNMAATDNHDPNGPELSVPTENGLDHLFVDNMDIVATASTVVVAVIPEIHDANVHCEHDTPTTTVPESTDPAGGDSNSAEKLSEATAPPTGWENHMHFLLDQDTYGPSVTPTVAEQQVCDPTLIPAASELPQEPDLSVPLSLYSVTDSQLHNIALRMELENQAIPESCDHQEDATELVCGLIRELSSLNHTVMAAHRETELLRRGNRLPKAQIRRTCGPRHAEI